MSLLYVKVGPQTVQVSSKFSIMMNNHIAPPTVCANCNTKLFIPDPPLYPNPPPPSHLHTHSTLTIMHTLHMSTSHTVGLETCREDHHTSQTVWTTNWYETLLLPPPFVPLLPPSSLPPLLLPLLIPPLSLSLSRSYFLSRPFLLPPTCASSTTNCSTKECEMCFKRYLWPHCAPYGRYLALTLHRNSLITEMASTRCGQQPPVIPQ